MAPTARIKKLQAFSMLRDCRATVEELISGGNINIMVAENLAENFTSAIVPPTIKKDKEERYLQEEQIYVVSFTGRTETEEVISIAKKEEDLVPADIFDLLTLSNTYPQSPGTKRKYLLEGGVVALGTLFPKKHNGRIIKGAYLAPVLCSEFPYNCHSLIRRQLRLNLTAFVDNNNGHTIIRSGDFWPTITTFAFKLG